MSVKEKCVHQGVDTGRHVLFNEQWERCKNCAYDPENNKRCTDYTKVEYYVSYEKKEVVPEPIEKKLEIVFVKSSELNLSALPVFQN